MKKTKNEDVNELAEKEVKKIIKDSIKATIIVLAILFFVMPLFTVRVYKKPIIYIYPEEEQEVKVSLSNKELLTCSYPKYEHGWDVIAKPNGDLTDLETGKQLYSLYYESDIKSKFKVEKEGFCVKKEDITSFLEEKLEILGLNYKEKEEFIVYWLPQLEKYDYVYIRFADKEEIERTMGLEINPKPDTLIRIMMTWKGLNRPIDVEEQELMEVTRKGYTVVEWGGTEI